MGRLGSKPILPVSKTRQVQHRVEWGVSEFSEPGSMVFEGERFMVVAEA
jgi:hypothetical protein